MTSIFMASRPGYWEDRKWTCLFHEASAFFPPRKIDFCCFLQSNILLVKYDAFHITTHSVVACILSLAQSYSYQLIQTSCWYGGVRVPYLCMRSVALSSLFVGLWLVHCTAWALPFHNEFIWILFMWNPPRFQIIFALIACSYNTTLFHRTLLKSYTELHPLLWVSSQQIFTVLNAMNCNRFVHVIMCLSLWKSTISMSTVMNRKHLKL